MVTSFIFSMINVGIYGEYAIIILRTSPFLAIQLMLEFDFSLGNSKRENFDHQTICATFSVIQILFIVAPSILLVIFMPIIYLNN